MFNGFYSHGMDRLGHHNISLPPISHSSSYGVMQTDIMGAPPPAPVRGMQAAAGSVPGVGGLRQPPPAMLKEFDNEIGRLRDENSQLRNQKDLMQRDYHSVMLENNSLHQKLENLENVFIGTTIEKHHDGSVSNSKISDTYTHSNVSKKLRGIDIE